MQEVTLPEILEAHTATVMDAVHVAVPGRVVSYDAVAQTAVIEPVVKVPRHVGDNNGEVTYHTLPTFPDVKVGWPSGGGFFVAMSMAAGDPVMLIFSEVALGEYLDTAEVSTPADARKHSAGYPIAWPGGARPDPKKLKDAPTDGVVIGKDDSDLQIKITAALITLGKGAADFVALASKVDAEITKLRTKLDAHITAYNAHVHPGVTAGAASTLIPLIPDTAPPAAVSVAATLVKAK